jgi:hypothetical protein
MTRRRRRHDHLSCVAPSPFLIYFHLPFSSLWIALCLDHAQAPTVDEVALESLESIGFTPALPQVCPVPDTVTSHRTASQVTTKRNPPHDDPPKTIVVRPTCKPASGRLRNLPRRFAKLPSACSLSPFYIRPFECRGCLFFTSPGSVACQSFLLPYSAPVDRGSPTDESRKVRASVVPNLSPIIRFETSPSAAHC